MGRIRFRFWLYLASDFAGSLGYAGATMAGRIVAIMRRSDENGGKRTGEDGGKKFVAKFGDERYGKNNGGML